MGDPRSSPVRRGGRCGTEQSRETRPLGRLASPWRAQVGEDGEDAAVAILALRDAELHQHVAHVCFDGPFAQIEALGDADVGEALCHCPLYTSPSPRD